MNSLDYDHLRKLLKERYNAALAAATVRFMEFLAGRSTLNEGLYRAARRLLDAEMDLSDKPADRIKVREKFLALAKDLEEIERGRHQAGRTSPAEYETARYFRLTAEVDLLKAKRRLEAGQGK